MPNADFIEQRSNSDPDGSHKSEKLSEKSSERRGRGRHPNSRANLRPYPKGVSGNPGGKPRVDVSAIIARAILEENAEAIYEGLAKALIKGNAYVFKELAERAYGKVNTPLTIGADESLATVLASSRQRVAAAAQPPTPALPQAPPAPPVAPAPKPVAVAKPAPAAPLPSELSTDERAKAFFDFTTGRVVR
jgi:hypothetical protein